MHNLFTHQMFLYGLGLEVYDNHNALYPVAVEFSNRIGQVCNGCGHRFL